MDVNDLASKPAAHVLVVDDEEDIRDLLMFNLRASGFEVFGATTASEGLELLTTTPIDVLVLDLMLPDLSGVEVCRRARSTPALSSLPILMLSARSDEYDRLLGFEAGADDYVVKPFSVREVVHRVRALTRRARPPTRSSEVLSAHGLVLDPLRTRVTAGGAEVSLRPLEFRLLEVLLRHPGKVFTRAELLERAWGVSGDMQTRTVDTHVRRLREALGEYADVVETLRGFGYRLREE